MATQLNNDANDSPLMAELDIVPQGPQDGQPAESQDSDLIMRTLFGDGNAPEPATKSGGDQASGTKSPDGASTESAPPKTAPAANGEGAVPQEQPPVPGTSSTQPGKEQTPAGVSPPQTPAPAQPAAAVEQAPAPSGLTAEDRLLLANAKALAEQNAQLLEQLRQGQQPSQPQAPTQPGEKAPEPVHLAVPNDLYAAVFSEDEATSKQGINVLISAIATKAVQEAVQRADALISDRLQAYGQGLEAKTSAQSQEADFYEAFPALKNELYLPVIQRESGAMFAQMPNATWTPEFRDALGARVNKQLQLLGFDVGMVPAGSAQGGTQQPPVQGFGAQPAAGSPPAPPAVMLDTSSRTAEPANAGDFIAATFL